MVFCVFNWHDELLRAQMDDDWTANILVCVCVVRVLSFFGGATSRKTKISRRKSQKERFFDDARLRCSWNRQRTLFLMRPTKREPKSIIRFVQKQKQHKNTSKHERHDEKSSIDIPDDAFFERKTTEKNEEDEFDESVHELFFFGVKKDDDKD